uniref:Uncharacterized protein n=1 Tax=Eutreptiella gymnastica TaxID=73025 RepID=A0A7S4CUN0_9EUGL|mmetsp:Transcript_58823/g.96633  ORF Transcript_58823/g.96633 Transcript_58823/m.96633 type:complete len:109 (+) Transcript_58823:788-1114(+)
MQEEQLYCAWQGRTADAASLLDLRLTPICQQQRHMEYSDFSGTVIASPGVKGRRLRRAPRVPHLLRHIVLHLKLYPFVCIGWGAALLMPSSTDQRRPVLEKKDEWTTF